MTFKLFVILGFFVYLCAMVSARPQNWQQLGWQQNPDFNNPFLPNRPDSNFSTTTTTAAPTAVPSPQYLACMRNCPTTMEYNPVCGSDSENYHNQARLDCAARCGRDVIFVRRGTCSAL